MNDIFIARNELDAYFISSAFSLVVVIIGDSVNDHIFSTSEVLDPPITILSGFSVSDIADPSLVNSGFEITFIFVSLMILFAVPGTTVLLIITVQFGLTFFRCLQLFSTNDVSIRPFLVGVGVQINTASHPVDLNERLTKDWNPDSGEYRWRTYALPITIGNGCWIGANATILGGVTIGDGAVVAAGAVVTQNVDANTLVGGVPCKVIRSLI